MQNLEKNNEPSLRYLKTDGLTDRQTDGQGWLHRAPLDKPGSKMDRSAQNKKIFLPNKSFLSNWTVPFSYKLIAKRSLGYLGFVMKGDRKSQI